MESLPGGSNVATSGLRRLDSLVDTTFYSAVIYAVWHLRPETLLTHLGFLGALVGLELARYTIDFVKFKREAAYHMWSSKLWGLMIPCVLCHPRCGPGRRSCSRGHFDIGIFADLEGLMISFTLRRWEHDVPTIFHALRIRRASRASAMEN